MVIAIAGMSGSGKSLLANFFRQRSLPVIHGGKLLIDAMKECGIDITPDNERKFREEMRAKKGESIFAEMALPAINDALRLSKQVIIDSVYSLSEYQTLKSAFGNDLVVIAVVSPKQLRYKRLETRRERPLTRSQAEGRDFAELEEIEKGGPIALADYTIVNDGEPSKLFAEATKILEGLGETKTGLPG
jgi:dephospho-CoA kinase